MSYATSVHPSIRLSVRPSVCLSACLSVRLSVCPSVCLSVCPSVCLSVCVNIFFAVLWYLVADWSQNQPECPLGGGACPKGVIFLISNCKLQNYAICNFLQIDLCNPILLKIDMHVRFTMMHVWKSQFLKIIIGSCKFMQLAIYLRINLWALSWLVF